MLASGLDVDSVVDIGCGNTNTLEVLKSVLRPKKVVGVDWSKKAIYECEMASKGWGCKTEWYVWDLYTGKCPYLKDESFDFVYSSHVIEHVDNPYQLLDEQWRLTRKGGMMAIVAPLGGYAKDHVRILEINDVVGHLQQYAVPVIVYPDMRQSEAVAGVIKV